MLQLDRDPPLRVNYCIPMADDEQSRPRFEEQAALQELEQLQRAIEESRRRRRQANDAFDTFLRSFNAPARRSDSAPPVEALEPAKAAPQVAPARLEPPPPPIPPPPPLPEPGRPELSALQLPELPLPELPPAAVPPPSQAAPELPVVPAALAVGSSPSRRRMPPLPAVAAVIVAVAVSLFIWRGTTQDDPVAVDRAAAQPTAAPPPARPPEPAPAVPVPVAELLAVRAVWVRVLVDGARVVERELPANARIPLSPQSRVLIRAGDAGAVRLFIRGADQGRLGPDGQVATREFVVNPAKAGER